MKIKLCCGREMAWFAEFICFNPPKDVLVHKVLKKRMNVKNVRKKAGASTKYFAVCFENETFGNNLLTRLNEEQQKNLLNKKLSVSCIELNRFFFFFFYIIIRHQNFKSFVRNTYWLKTLWLIKGRREHIKCIHLQEMSNHHRHKTW